MLSAQGQGELGHRGGPHGLGALFSEIVSQRALPVQASAEEDSQDTANGAQEAALPHTHPNDSKCSTQGFPLRCGLECQETLNLQH